MKPSAMQSLIGGLLGTLLFGWVMLSTLVFDPPGRLTAADVKTVSGRIVKYEKSGNNSSGSLDVWIEGREVPFRSFDGPYPGSFDPDVLALLKLGVKAEVSVKTGEMSAPRRNLAQNQYFYPLVALDLNGKPALSLEAYNQWSVKNQKVAQWFLPLMFCGSLYLLWAGIMAQQSRLSAV
jgi:hypothetical protein